jgi:hypothetical protein
MVSRGVLKILMREHRSRAFTVGQRRQTAVSSPQIMTHPSRCTSTSLPAVVYSTLNRCHTTCAIRASGRHRIHLPSCTRASLHRAPASLDASASRPPAAHARRPEPHLLPASPLLRGQPATIAIPHDPGMPHPTRPDSVTPVIEDR